MESTGPDRYVRRTLKRRGLSHSNGASSHSSGTPSFDSRNRRRALAARPRRSTSGMPASRLTRFVSETSGQTCSGLDSRSRAIR